MKLNNALWIFCILFAGLILCAFIHTNFEHLYLGNSLEGMTSDSNGNNMSGQIEINGKTYYINSSDSSGNVNYDNYNHYDQTSTSSALISGTTFYNDKGGSATVITTANGTQIIKITTSQTDTPVVFNSVTVDTYEGPNGGKATLVKSSTGESALKVVLPDGTVHIFTTTPPPYTNNTNTDSQTSTSINTTDLGSANAYKNQYYNTTPTSTTVDPYASSFTQGIPKNAIPPGDEDLYILKSSIVPPVCPACPPPIMQCDKSEKCPPCPACARCKEPAFECKKVPNYSAIAQSDFNNNPIPVLNSFSTFGM